jgi:hypothetical protein
VVVSDRNTGEMLKEMKKEKPERHRYTEGEFTVEVFGNYTRKYRN